MFSSWLHPERGYEEAQKKYQPYYQGGLDAQQGLQGAMKNLLDPEALQSKWAQGYEESPYAKQMEQKATQGGLNAASSMGLMGSTPALQAIQAGTSRIGSADRQQYLSNLMDMYKTGAGIGQNMYNTGASMSKPMAETEYGKTNAPGQMFGNLVNTGLNLAGSYLTGGMGTGGFGRGAWKP